MEPPSAVELTASLKKGEPTKKNTRSLSISLLSGGGGTEIVSPSTNYYQTRKQESLRVNRGAFDRQKKSPKESAYGGHKNKPQNQTHAGIMEKKAKKKNPGIVDLSAESLTPR